MPYTNHILTIAQSRDNHGSGLSKKIVVEYNLGMEWFVNLCMGKVRGSLTFTGSVGGLTFYYLNGQLVVRQKAGVSGDVIKSDERFVRTRENNAEFRNITQAGKLVRRGLGSFITNCSDSQMHSRFVGVMSRIRHLDKTNSRGKRNVHEGIKDAEALELLKAFHFNADCPLHRIQKLLPALDTSTGAMAFTQFNPIAHTIAPKMATHVVFQGAWCRVDFDKNQVESTRSIPEVIPIEDKSFTFTLTPAIPVMTTGVNIFLIKVLFQESINGTSYPMKESRFNSVGILDVLL